LRDTEQKVILHTTGNTPHIKFPPPSSFDDDMCRSSPERTETQPDQFECKLKIHERNFFKYSLEIARTMNVMKRWGDWSHNPLSPILFWGGSVGHKELTWAQYFLRRLLFHPVYSFYKKDFHESPTQAVSMLLSLLNDNCMNLDLDSNYPDWGFLNFPQ
jgi:hypothetical protein